MINCFEGETADEVWCRASTALLKDRSVQTQPSRSGNTREMSHVVMQIHDPRQRWVSSRREALNVAFALAEVIWILDGRRDSAFLNYFNRRLPEYAGKGPTYYGAYGERLQSRFGFSQIVQAFEALRSQPQSRQVVLQIWDATTDLPTADGKPRAADIPCNLVSLLKVRDGCLNWTQIMRSNDAYRGIPHNIVQFTSLQEVMAGWIGVQPGSYTHWSDSFHFYEDDLTHPPIDATRATLPANTDSICLPRQDFDAIWPEIRRIADAVTDGAVTADQLQRQIDVARLPLGWGNILRVLVAEGLRRRNAMDTATNVMRSVGNPLLVALWNRWLARVRTASF